MPVSETPACSTISPATALVNYRGRFAPSPTGPLHFGSLVAAVGSFLQARRQNGQWLLRIDNLDHTRTQTSSTDAILFCLEKYGFEWDEAVYYQQDYIDEYQAALESLLSQDRCYRCACTRKTVQASMQAQRTHIYSGHCRELQLSNPQASIRMRVTSDVVEFNDQIQGPFVQQLANDVGDFIIKRADNIYAYQLAVVVDDHIQKISEIVRGADLLDNTPRQIYLQQCLHYATPSYAHLPVVVDKNLQKLSKQTGAKAVDTLDPSTTLFRALEFLQQRPPKALRLESPRHIWQWAITNWKIEQIQASSSDMIVNQHEIE